MMCSLMLCLCNSLCGRQNNVHLSQYIYVSIPRICEYITFMARNTTYVINLRALRWGDHAGLSIWSLITRVLIGARRSQRIRVREGDVTTEAKVQMM